MADPCLPGGSSIELGAERPGHQPLVDGWSERVQVAGYPANVADDEVLTSSLHRPYDAFGDVRGAGHVAYPGLGVIGDLTVASEGVMSQVGVDKRGSCDEHVDTGSGELGTQDSRRTRAAHALTLHSPSSPAGVRSRPSN